MPNTQKALNLDNRPYQIYALIDPREGIIRYVGISIDAHVRLYGHLNDRVGGGNQSKVQWLKELKQLGISPTLEILETVDAGTNAYTTARERERYWINEMVRRGNALLNKKDMPRYEVSVAAQEIIELEVTTSKKPIKPMSGERPLEEAEEVLTVKDIAKQLRVSEKTVRNWIASGDLAAFDLGRGYRIKRDDYDDFLRNRYRGQTN